MGMGASCNRLDCSVVVEDCNNKYAPKRHSSIWYHCAGHQPIEKGSCASQDQDYDLTELIATQEDEVQVVCRHFSVRRMVGVGPPGSADWRRRYILGRELGAGQTAVVFEGFAAAPGLEDTAGSCTGRPDGATGSSNGAGTAEAAPAKGSRGGGRRVALKRFYNAGTLMFQQELKALSAVGVHPHVLRLLESFEGGSEDADAGDVLVLEHCDGGDVYDLYAANNGCCMLEAFVLQLVRQLLLALEHLSEHGVEHRDVKPENLLLYGSSLGKDSMAMPQLKLADFGWAVVVQPNAGTPVVPPEGVGSLWYAPPELNPPVEGVDLNNKDVPLGLSDMWSVGIIAYLLLIGHSPFNPALRIQDPLERENEVIRLAAMGQINSSSRPWACLSDEARSFICALIQPEPLKRLSPVKAWNHPFIARWQTGYVDGMGAQPPALSPSAAAERCKIWQRLDGFQKLCWVAFARAISEPELVQVPALYTFIGQQSMGTIMYLEQLAVELAAAALPAWFQPQAAWGDVLVLAFHYLDVDSDGLLSVGDLMQHLVGEEASESVDSWVVKWQHRREATPAHAALGLGLIDFRLALCASCSGQRPPPPAAGGAAGAPSQREQRASRPPATGDGSDGGNGASGVGGPTQRASCGDAALESRMQAIDEVCQRFLDEEFDDFGFGF